MDSNIKHLYDTMISRGYTGLGDFSNFEGKMKDSGKRKLVYDHLMQDDYFSEIGDFSKFESALGYSPVERKDYVSQSRANPAPIALRQEADVPMKDQSEYVNPWTNSPDYNFESLRKKGKIETATPPPPTEYEKDSSFMNSWVADFIQRTGGQGLNLLGGGFGFLDKAAKDVSNMGLGTYGGMFGDSAKLLKEAGQKLMDKGDRHKEKSFTDLWKEGDYTGSISNLFMEGGSMIIPQIAAAMATGGTSAAGLMGASVYSDKLDQLDESNPDMPELAKRVNAISTSAFELLSEKLSLGPVVKWLKGVYNSKGKDVAQKELAGAIENMLGKAYKDAGLLFAPVWEGVTEAASQIAENITDKVTGADPDKNISDGVFEAFGYGVAGGAPIGLIGYGKNKYDNYKYNKMSSPEPSTNSSKTDQGVNTTPQFTKSIIDDAFEQGRNMSDKGDLRDLSLQMEASRTALTEKNPNLAIRMEQYIDNGASENQINEMLKGVDNETRELAYDFYINTQKIKGVEDKSIENINNEVDSYMSDNIIPYVSISPNGRQVISTATFKEGLENKKVYIRSINGDNVIISDNGNNRMVPMSSLSDIEENDVEQIRNSYRQQLLVTRQSELDMAMNHNPKTQLPKPGLVIWNGDNAFILQGQDENGDWIAQPAALDKETGQVAPKAGSAPAMPITERDILALQDAMYDAQQANEVSPEDDSVASADAEITSAPPMEDAINQPTSEIETEGAIDQIAQPSNVENPSMVMREDGTPDFVSSGTEMALDFLYDKYGDKMPRKIEVTRKSFDESLKKASDALEKAQEAYDDAPIGKEDKAEAALIKARQEYEAIKVEADFWANLDNRLKEESEKATATSGQVIDISEKEDTEPVDIKNEDVVTQESAPGGIKPIGKGVFGNIYDQFKGKFKEAISFLKQIKEGEAIAAIHHKDIGDISIVWGNEKAGLEKILRKHPEVVDNLQEIIDGMEIVQQSDNRIKLESKTHFAVISKEFQGEPRSNWLLTAYEKRDASDGSMDIDSEPVGKQNGTAPLQDISIRKDNVSSSENQANEVKSFVAPSPKESENPLDYAERIVEAKRLHDEELKVNTNPSEAQKEAGNYKKGHIKINGFDVTIEQPAGSVRSGKDANGKEWSVTMNNTYGYIRGTESVDGDHIDVFLGPDMNSDMVYVVDQVNTDGSFDEHKVMIGFSSLEDARSAYLSNYEEGWQGLGNITGVALDEFKKWIDSSKRKTKPFSEYKGIKREEEILPRKVKKLSLVDKDDYITSAERKHIKAFLESGLKEARVNNSIYEISNIGDDGVYEIVRRFNYTDPLTLVKDENGKLVNKRGEGEHVIRVKPTFEEIRPDSGIRFREVKDKNGEKSLVGLHNISEEKLLKALRQGGFANPSAAVIDISRQSHTGYGSISLVLPSSMIEKRTGKNAGTWSQDAWTPIYPTIERQFSGKGSDVFSKDLQKLPEEMRSTTKSGMDSYMDGRGEDSLAYMYLYEQGKAPEIARTKPSYPEKTRTEVEDATNGSFSMSGLSDKQLSRLKDAYMEYKGFSTEGYNEAIKLRRAKLEEAIGKMNPRSILYEKRKTDLERIDKYGFDYSAVESFMKSVRDDISNSDKVDAHGTMRDSWNFIEENGMRGDFNKWLDKLNERYGIKEIIFNGFTPSGIRKYIPNTLENVSKFMKKQGRSASVGIGASFQNFAASLLDAKGSLKDIRKDKGKLTTDHADVDAFRDKWSKVFHELGEKLQPDAKGYDDYGLYRLAEAARSKDPQKYIKEEYGIDFSDEDVKTLNEMVDAIRNEYPAMYFETKFERPVYLEEFAAAVVPDNVDGDIRKAIYDAGLKIFTYKADDEISRNEAVKQASEIDGVRFRSIGEKGAANLNKAETIESSINDWSNKLNTPVRVIHDVDDINDTDENMLARKRDSKGWYDTSTGEIVIVSPNSTSVGDAQRTFLHEVVGHHGLRELFGDDFDTFLDNVYRNANEDIRKNIIDRTKGNPLNLREATEEYLAELAERGFDNKVDRSLWEKIKDAFLDMLRKAGISLDFKLSDNDLRYILWRSYKNLEQGNLMDVAEDTVMRNDLGVGDFSVRFREAKTEVENEEPLNKEMVDAWDKVASSDSFKFKEAMVDSLTAIDEFLKLLAKKTKSKILDYENPYYALIALSSKNKADMDSFDSKFLNPLNEAIRALIGDVSEVSKKGLRRTWDWSKGPLRDLVKYVQSKHGIERNRDMSVRDGIETLKAFDVDALSKMGVISESDLKNAKKTAEKVAEEKGSEAYKKTYDKVLGKELKKGVDKGKAERSAEIAADYRQSFVKSEIYNKEMDKYKEKVTGTLIDRWEDSKKDILKKGLAWDEEQKELDREALSFQWKLGDNSYGVILGKDYSGLSSVFKPSEDGANKDKWLSDAYDFVRDYESTHNMVLVDNLWDKVHNVSEYTLRRQYESGLISKSYMDKNLSRFKYFIPLRGFSDNIASDVYDYIDATEIKMGNPVKTAKGRISEADNPFAGLIHVGYGSITAGNRNLAKQRFLNLASNHDTGGLITIDNIWVRNVGTEENPEWVESIPQIPDNASGEEVAKAVKDHEEMMRELREEGKAELIKGGRSDIPYKTLYDQRSQHQVQVFVGGNRYVMTVNGNPRLAQAVNGLTNPDVKDDLAYVVARNLKTFMAGAFTSKNVAFSFANLIRDTPYANNSVFVTENFRYFKDFSGNQRRALFGLRSLGRNLYKYKRGEIDISDKEQAIFKEFMDNGGATGYTFVETQKEYAKDLANKLEKLSDGNIGKLPPKELVSTVFECFEFMGNVAELVNRYAAYKTSREHGRSIDRSINDAKEVSVNFNKKGAGKKTKSDKWYINTAAWISEYGRDWVLFFNAAVQSMYKEYSMLINHPIKGIGSRIAPLIFMGSSVSLLNNMFMPMLFAYLGWDSDDDDRDYFDSLSDHERQNNICIRLTHGRWLKIPLSPELANYFKIGDIIAGQLSGKREVEAMDVVKTGIDMVSPLNINWEYDSWKFALNLLPTVVQPIAQNASNVNFMGNPIYKTSMNKANDYDPEYTKVYRSTSTTMVELSRALNSLTGGDDVKRGLSFNPATWQNIFSGYTGGFGTVALGVSDLVLDILSGEDGDMPVSRYPLLSRFLTGGDKDLKLSRMNSIYNKKVVDFVSEMDHDYKGYLEKSMDPSINILDRAEYIVKLEKFMKSDDFKKSQELSQYVRAISDMERFLREVGSDNDSLENQVYELKLRALEIFEDSDE